MSPLPVKTGSKLGGQYTDLEKKRDGIVLYLCGSMFLVAVIYSVFSNISPFVPWWIFAIGGSVCASGRYWLINLMHRRICELLLLLTVAGLGLSWGSQHREAQLHARWTSSQNLTAIVQIEGLSDDVDDSWRQVVRVESPTQYQGQRWLVSLPYGTPELIAKQADQRFVAGQRWHMQLQIKPIRGVASPHAFDVEQWLLTRHIVAKATLKQAQWLSDEADLLDQIQQVRGELRQVFKSINSPEAGVLLGLLTGDRALIDPVQRQWYQHVGISHLLAISGPHVLFLASIGTWCLIQLLNLWPHLYVWQIRQYLALPMWWGMVVAYAVLAGFEVPAQRTVAMATIFVMTIYMQKHLNVLKSLLLIAVCMVAFDPVLLWSAAFWLSYGAVAVLLIWSGWQQTHSSDRDQGLRRVWQKLRQMGYLQAMLTVCLLPLILAIFGQMSWWSWPVNLIAIPLLGVVIVGLNLLGLLLWWIQPAWALEVWTSAEWVLLGFHAGIRALVQQYPDALMPWRISTLQLMVLSVMVVWWLLPRGVVARWPMLFLLPIMVLSRPQSGLTVQILDVGQGLSVLVHTAQHRMLFDTGVASMTKQVVLPALQTMGRPQLDLVLLSHADADHTGGASLLRPAVFVKSWRLGQPMDALKGLYASQCEAGQKWQWDGVTFEILAPFAEGWSDLEDNDQSCVLKITTTTQQGTPQSVLIMADAGHLTEKVLMLMCADLKADLLIVGHHGSRTSTSAAFVAAVQPQRAVISAGYANRFHHPHPEVLQILADAGVQVDSTIADGTLTYHLEESIPLSVVRHRQQWPWLKWPKTPELPVALHDMPVGVKRSRLHHHSDNKHPNAELP